MNKSEARFHLFWMIVQWCLAMILLLSGIFIVTIDGWFIVGGSLIIIGLASIVNFSERSRKFLEGWSK